MNIRSFARKEWLALVGLGLGVVGIVVGIAVSYYFYLESRTEREPVFLVDPARTPIVRAAQVSTAPIRITRQDGKSLKGDLNAVKFYLWNDGRLSIRPEHVLKPIVISLTDPAAEILDARFLNVSRDVTGLELIRRANSPGQLEVRFTILDRNDGGVALVLYEGPPDAPLKITGAIEGVQRIQTELSIARRYWREIQIVGVCILMFIVIEILSRLAGAVSAVPVPKVVANASPRASIFIGLVVGILALTALAVAVVGVASVVTALMQSPIPNRSSGIEGLVPTEVVRPDRQAGAP